MNKTYICTHCQSDDILHLAWTRWNNLLACFEMVQSVGRQSRCGKCDATFHYLQPTPLPDTKPEA